MRLSRICFAVLIIVCIAPKTQAQSCLENIYKANKLLDAGNTDGCLALVNPCSAKGTDESVRWQAYRLKSIAYLLKGYADSAKIAVENMLDINPTYKPNLLKDPKDFINLMNSITVIPKFTLGLAFSAGTNTSYPEVRKGYVLSDYNKTYTAGSGIQFGTNLGFYVNPKLVIELGFLATTKKYDINYAFSNWEVSVKEQLNYLDMPLTFKYIVRPQKRLRFFAQGGAYAGYLLYSTNDFRSTYVPQEQDNKLDQLNSIGRRHRWNFGVTGGLGAYYKLNKGHLSIQANYYRSFSNITKTEKRYDYTEQIYTYFYVDDDIILHNLAISIGGAYYLNYKVYRAKKK